MLQSLNLQADYAVLPPLSTEPVVSAPVVAELDRHDLANRMAALHEQIHKERRAEFNSNLLNLWPVALGLTLSCCATALRDAAAGYTPLLAKFLFPLSALAVLHDVHFGTDAMPPISLVMLYAQFALDGLLACMLLRQRSHWVTVCVQIALFHGLFLLSIGWAAGSFGALMN